MKRRRRDGPRAERRTRANAGYSVVPASATGQLDWGVLKQLLDMMSQQLTPPFETAGQLFWQSESELQLEGHVGPLSSPPPPFELLPPLDVLPELEPFVASNVAMGPESAKALYPVLEPPQPDGAARTARLARARP
jgi:hypothetical protein